MDSILLVMRVAVTHPLLCSSLLWIRRCCVALVFERPGRVNFLECTLSHGSLNLSQSINNPSLLPPPFSLQVGTIQIAALFQVSTELLYIVQFTCTCSYEIYMILSIELVLF